MHERPLCSATLSLYFSSYLTFSNHLLSMVNYLLLRGSPHLMFVTYNVGL